MSPPGNVPAAHWHAFAPRSLLWGYPGPSPKYVHSFHIALLSSPESLSAWSCPKCCPASLRRLTETLQVSLSALSPPARNPTVCHDCSRSGVTRSHPYIPAGRSRNRCSSNRIAIHRNVQKTMFASVVSDRKKSLAYATTNGPGSDTACPSVPTQSLPPTNPPSHSHQTIDDAIAIRYPVQSNGNSPAS